jgi:hypothetical protein
MKAEYMVLSKADEYFLKFKIILSDMQFPKIPIPLFCDNHSGIDLANNSEFLEL